MANTEVKSVLKLVYDALNVIESRLATVADGDVRQIQLLQRAESVLWALQGELVVDDINANIKAIKADARRLERVNADLKADIKSLKNVANAVQKVADALGVLVQIITLAVGAGL